MYSIIAVSDDACDVSEQLGTKFKFWFTDDDKQQTLYKQGRHNTGENWSEKICCELAQILGIPHVNYDLANWRGNLGVVSKNMVNRGERLVLGNEVTSPNVMRAGYKTNHHLIRKVTGLLRQSIIQVPKGFDEISENLNANDVFVGYLVLDALVGNTDRHDENWAIIVSKRIQLAPTYDHASSLGRELTDGERLRRLTTKDQRSTVEAYAARAYSALFDSPNDSHSLTTLDAFLKAAETSPLGKAFWLQKLEMINEANIDAILTQIPDDIMSYAAKAFAKRLLLFNKDRIQRSGFQ